MSSPPGAGFPARLVQLDLSEPIPDRLECEDFDNALVLVCWWTRPLGIIPVSLPAEGPALLDLIRGRLAAEIEAFSLAHGVSLPDRSAGDSFQPGDPPQFYQDRRAYLDRVVKATVVVCTRDCPTGQLARTLDSLLALDYPDFEILLVENAPMSDLVRRFVEAWYPGQVRCLLEPRPGLSWARNCGLDHAAGGIVAFTDDDAVVDPHWLAAIGLAFDSAEDVGCVTGLTGPQAITTQAQQWFEEFGGLSKGRGYARQMFNTTTHAAQDPLFPAPAFGAGVNMAFRTEVLKAMGGFDVALGAGTLSQGGEDTAAFYDCLVAGHTLVYEPDALVFHDHRETYDELKTQLSGYSTAVTAFYMRCILRSPAVLFRLIGLVPRALGYVFRPDSQRVTSMSATYPKDLDRAQLWGLLTGPLMYLRAKAAARRLARNASRGGS